LEKFLRRPYRQTSNDVWNALFRHHSHLAAEQLDRQIMVSQQSYPTCEAVGHCPKPTADAAPFHHFTWDGERDAERMEKIHCDGGKGHDDPMSDYGAVVCKTCGLKALVRSDADDFPEI